jgi:hypothetical protein
LMSQRETIRGQPKRFAVISFKRHPLKFLISKKIKYFERRGFRG